MEFITHQKVETQSSLPGVYIQTQVMYEKGTCGVLELLANLCIGTTSL